MSVKDDQTENDESKVVVECTVITDLPGTDYELQINNTNHVFTGYVSGRMRRKYIRIAEKDVVYVEVDPVSDPELKSGRIIYRKDDRRETPPRILEKVVNL